MCKCVYRFILFCSSSFALAQVHVRFCSHEAANSYVKKAPNSVTTSFGHFFVFFSDEKKNGARCGAQDAMAALCSKGRASHTLHVGGERMGEGAESVFLL